MSDLTKVSFNAVPKTLTALQSVVDRSVLNNTETLNRAAQAYAGLMGLSTWGAIRALLIERASFRRYAKKAR
jgi:hypothetical protein